MGRIVSVNVNAEKDFRKLPRKEARLVENYGLEGDRHAGRPLRQVSLLDAEVLRDLAARGIVAAPGVYGENFTLEGVDVNGLPDGAVLRLGEAEVAISAGRPACREMNDVDPRALKQMVGRAGKMARVLRGGVVRPGDDVSVLQTSPAADSAASKAEVRLEP